MSFKVLARAMPIRSFCKSSHNLQPVSKPTILNPKVTFNQFLNTEFRSFKKCRSIQVLSKEDETHPYIEYLQYLRFLIGRNPVQSSHPHLPIMDFVYLKPPQNFKPKMEIAGCFVAFENKFLFLKQQPNDSEANKWGVPGGKIAKAESAITCSIREVYEETGLVLKNSPRFLREVYIRLPEMDFVYKMFEVNLDQHPESIKIDAAEHTEYKWMTLPEALTYPLIRGEDECILLAYWDSRNLA